MSEELQLGVLERISDLRCIWANEASDFTRWLSEEKNLSLLGKTLGINLECVETEEHVGDFRADIYAKNLDTDEDVIIENQLEQSNHKHLGQIITYAAGKQASTVIWIVKEAREEHAKAIEWLNEHTDDGIDFFLVEIELWKIGGSAIAPKFNVVERPNQWAKSQKQTGADSETSAARLNFWTSFHEFIAENGGRLGMTVPQPTNRHSVSFRIGTTKCHLKVGISTRNSYLTVGVYIKDRDLYERCCAEKKVWEEKFGRPLEYRDGTNCSIDITIPDVDTDHPERCREKMELCLKYLKEFKALIKSIEK